MYDLVPNSTAKFLRQPLSINSWGMRDAPRTLEKPDSTVRIAIFGPSFVFGSGVLDSEPFPAQFEQQLNSGVSATTGKKYEALNFAAPAHSLLQEFQTFQDDALRFKPDVVIITNYLGAPLSTSQHLTEVVDRRYAIPYPAIDSLVRRWHATPLLPYAELLGLMRIVTDDANTWAIKEVARISKERGIIPVFMTLDVVGVPTDPNSVAARVARDAGFVMLDMSDVYGPSAGHAALRLAPWDAHPNPAGYKLVAQRLVQEFRKHPELLTASSSPSTNPRATP